MNVLHLSQLGAALAPLAFWSACALAALPPTHLGSVASGGLGAGCNGPVNALVEAPDGSLYVGGDFSLCGEVSANNIARFDPSTQLWAVLGNSQANGVNGPVETLALHDDALFVGGAFSQVLPGGSAAFSTSLARWDGSDWSRLAGDAEVHFEEVSSLHSSAGGLYVGGRLSVTPTSGDRFEGVALWTGERFAPIAPGAEASNIGEVHSIALYNGEVHIAGFLNGLSIHGHRPTGPRRIARWSKGSWRVVGSEGGGSLEGGISVLALRLAVHEGSLYLGGEFSTVDAGAAAPVTANNIARWNGSQWSAVGTGVDGRVLALQSSAQGMLAGGRFASAGAVPQSRLARWTGTAWESIASQALGGEASEVRSLAQTQQGVLVGGRFGWANGSPDPQVLNHAAWISAGEWQPLGEVNGTGANGPVYVLREHSGELFAGGDFTTIGGVAARHVARHDGIGWRSLGVAGSGTDGAVYALESSGANLIIGGDFTTVHQGATSAIATRLAGWNGSSLTALGPNVGVDGRVRTLLADGSTLIVGGAFANVSAEGGSIQAGSIARFDGSAWSVFGASGFNGVAGEVLALARWNGELFVGGRFLVALSSSEIDPLEARSIARWNGTRWATLGSDGGAGLRYGPANLGLAAEVHALQAEADGLYVGGMFHEANAGGAVPVPASSIARWTGSQWQALGGPGQGPIGYVFALHLQENQLLVGGLFSHIRVSNDQEIPSNSLAVFERGRWAQATAVVGSGQAFEFVAALQGDIHGIDVAGRFGEAGGRPASHVARIELPMFASGFEAPDAASQ